MVIYLKILIKSYYFHDIFDCHILIFDIISNYNNFDIISNYLIFDINSINHNFDILSDFIDVNPLNFDIISNYHDLIFDYISLYQDIVSVNQSLILINYINFYFSCTHYICFNYCYYHMYFHITSMCNFYLRNYFNKVICDLVIFVNKASNYLHIILWVSN